MITLKLFFLLAPFIGSAKPLQDEPTRPERSSLVDEVTSVAISTTNNIATKDTAQPPQSVVTETITSRIDDKAGQASESAITINVVTDDDNRDDDDKGDRNDDHQDRPNNGRRPDSHSPRSEPDGRGPGNERGGPPAGFNGPPMGFGGGGFGPRGNGFGATSSGFSSREVSANGSSLDANKNGVLEREELDRLPAQVQQLLKARGVELEPGMTAESFRFSIRSNFVGHSDERRSESRPDSKGPDHPSNSQGPTNGPRTMVPPWIHQFPTPHDPPALQGPSGGGMNKVMFELLDMNHDGQLSREEFQRLSDAMQRADHPRPLIHSQNSNPPGNFFAPPRQSAPGPRRDGQHGDTRPSENQRSRPDQPDRRGFSQRRPDPDNDDQPFHRGDDPRPDNNSRPSRERHDRDDSFHRDSDRDHERGPDRNSDRDMKDDHSNNAPIDKAAAIVAQPRISADWI